MWDARNIENPSQSEAIKDCGAEASTEKVEQSTVSAMMGLMVGLTIPGGHQSFYYLRRMAPSDTERSLVMFSLLPSYIEQTIRSLDRSPKRPA